MTAPAASTPARGSRTALPWSNADRQRTAALTKHLSQVSNGLIDRNAPGIDTVTGLMLIERDMRDMALLDPPPGVDLHRYWHLQDRIIEHAGAGIRGYVRGHDRKATKSYTAVRRDLRTLISVLNRALGTSYAN